jgi:hypothetical protein
MNIDGWISGIIITDAAAATEASSSQSNRMDGASNLFYFRGFPSNPELRQGFPIYRIRFTVQWTGGTGTHATCVRTLHAKPKVSIFSSSS